MSDKLNFALVVASIVIGMYLLLVFIFALENAGADAGNCLAAHKTYYYEPFTLGIKGECR